MGSKIWATALVCATTMSLSLPAGAAPVTANSVQVGLGFRYGVELNDGDFNPWGTGLGFDAGYTLPNALFLGGQFDYFFGGEVDTADGTLSGNIWQLTPEAGYDLALGEAGVLRPKLGLGVASLNAEACVTGASCTSDSETDFVAAPGAALLIITKGFSLTLDARYDMIFADPETLNALIFSVGIGF